MPLAGLVYFYLRIMSVFGFGFASHGFVLTSGTNRFFFHCLLWHPMRATTKKMEKTGGAEKNEVEKNVAGKKCVCSVFLCSTFIFIFFLLLLLFYSFIYLFIYFFFVSHLGCHN